MTLPAKGFEPAKPVDMPVDAAGGYFGLESEPGGGTTVTVHIPVAATP